MCFWHIFLRHNLASQVKTTGPFTRICRPDGRGALRVIVSEFVICHIMLTMIYIRHWRNSVAPAQQPPSFTFIYLNSAYGSMGSGRRGNGPCQGWKL